MRKIAILNAAIVTDGAVRTGDVWIRNARSEAIGGDLGARAADIRIDAGGEALMPGALKAVFEKLKVDEGLLSQMVKSGREEHFQKS